MFLFKPKTKSSELPPLPPPPPDAIELDSFETYEEQPKYKPKFYDEFIKSKPVQTFPELQEFKNLVSIPDDAKEFLTTADLNSIIKSAVGIELNI